MSIASITYSFLALKPRFWVEGEVLKARSSIIGQMFGLFCYCRDLEVDRQQRVFRIRTRWLWALRSDQQIPVDAVEYIDYGFHAQGTEWGWTRDGYGAHDQMESFSIALVMKLTSDRVPLYCFRGEGSRSTGWHGVVVGGDDLVDLSGDQGRASRRFVDLLCEWTGLATTRQFTPIADSKGSINTCTACERANPPTHMKCQYCGAPTTASQ